MHISIFDNPLFHQLRDTDNILIAGAGGGFDVYSGVPLLLALHAQGKKVHLANLSFSFLHEKLMEKEVLSCFKVTKASDNASIISYFPEKQLVDWLFLHLQEEFPIYVFNLMGVRELTQIYQHLIEKLNIGAVVLVDGGTDSLVFVNESDLGTPSEDFLSMAALHQVKGNVKKFLVNLGFGIDHFHGVSHYDILHNISQLASERAYLGSFSLHNTSEEAQAFLDLVAYANQRTPQQESIVCNSVASAVEGHFGNYHATNRTGFSELFINSLMNIYWVFDLEGVIKYNLIIPHLLQTNNGDEVRQMITEVRRHLLIKERKSVPL